MRPGLIPWPFYLNMLVAVGLIGTLNVVSVFFRSEGPMEAGAASPSAPHQGYSYPGSTQRAPGPVMEQERKVQAGPREHMANHR